MIRRRFDLLLPAVAYGDAAGLPTEAKSAAWIEDQYGRIEQLIPPEHNGIFAGDLPAGTTSDDTQLTRVVASSLLEREHFSLDDIANRHVDAYYETTKTTTDSRTIVQGWGRSTTEAIERLISGVDPRASGRPGGAGNGIIMKMAPLSLWHVGQQTPEADRLRHYDLLTTMTHDSDIARACTRIHGEVLRALMRATPHTVNLDNLVVAQAKMYGGIFPEDMELITRAVVAPCETDTMLRTRYAEGRSGKDYGFYAAETLAIAYDIFAASGNDLQIAVYRAVNLGGDSDSVASIVASMVVAAGYETGDTLPDDFTYTDNYLINHNLSRKLAKAAFKKRTTK